MEEKIEYLVADTTAFINAVKLNDYAINVLTVPDVIKEVRNKRQIRRLCVLPYDLQIREPRTESVKHCVEFAKKTGDYASLSGIDIKVISLTYELEADNVGTKHLRMDPVVSKVIASKVKPAEFDNHTNLPGWYNPKGESTSVEINEDELDEDDSLRDDVRDNIDAVKDAIETQILNSNESPSYEDDLFQEELQHLIKNLKCDSSDNNDCNILLPKTEDGYDSNYNQGYEDEEGYDSNFNQGSEEEMGNKPHVVRMKSELNVDGAFDDGWITPANIKNVKKSLGGQMNSDGIPPVACMSTDYAVQNVLRQMNLEVAALDGRVIKHLRTYILRCYACFKTTSIMTKVFCPNCGNKTLKRVAVSLDENGKQVIHINTRRPLTAKYKNQSLPRFQGGKHSRNPILFEDQPIPRQMPSRVAKTKTNALNEDYIAGFSPFVMRDIDSKSALLRSKGNLKEWARNNTFEEDRRRKHYNRVYK